MNSKCSYPLNHLSSPGYWCFYLLNVSFTTLVESFGLQGWSVHKGRSSHFLREGNDTMVVMVKVEAGMRDKGPCASLDALIGIHVFQYHSTL